METIGITGANGLVGSYFVRYLLSAGYSIRALKRKTSDLSLLADVKDKVDWIEGDILDVFSLEETFSGCDLVLHTAALVSYDSRDRDRIFQTNIEGTANVVNTCLNLNINRLLYISSIAAIGRKSDSKEWVKETNSWDTNKGLSDYSISKHEAELEVWRGMTEGLEVIIVNPSIILGAGFWSAGSSRLFTTVSKKFPFYTSGSTGFVDVRDVVTATMKLHEKNIINERFILNSGNYAYKYIFDLIAKGFGVKGPTIKAGKTLSSFAWRAGAIQKLLTGKTPSVTKATAKIAQKNLQFSNEKITSRLEFKFLPIEKTIAETTESFKTYQKTGNTPPLNF